MHPARLLGCGHAEAHIHQPPWWEKEKKKNNKKKKKKKKKKEEEEGWNKKKRRQLQKKKVSEHACLCCLSILAAELGRLCWNEGAILKFHIWVVAIHLPACMHSYMMHPSPKS